MSFDSQAIRMVWKVLLLVPTSPETKLPGIFSSWRDAEEQSPEAVNPETLKKEKSAECQYLAKLKNLKGLEGERFFFWKILNIHFAKKKCNFFFKKMKLFLTWFSSHFFFFWQQIQNVSVSICVLIYKVRRKKLFSIPWQGTAIILGAISFLPKLKCRIQTK